ncbi:MAG TPA: hypothetical protein VFO46_19920 [Candidatus Sulfotelmatobacter sp.]|nr:hypothetical protein [Candidatus Sulfotelmatobacter sp.]
MRATLCAVLIFSAVLLAAQDATIEKIGKSPVETKFGSGGRIRMDLCSSGIDVIGKESGQLRVSYDAGRGDVKVRIRVSGDRAELRVTDCPRNNFRVTIEVPKSSALYVRMFAGELNVKDVTGDKDVVLHFGQLTMDVGKPDSYARVDASVNSGDLEASAFNISKGGLFRSFDRSGPGTYRVHAHVGAGQLELR